MRKCGIPKVGLTCGFALLSLALAAPAEAVPSFARQTGQECIACHVSFPELTPYGRYFKLTGYTIGKAAITSEGVNYLPLAVMAQASITNTRNNHATDPDTGDTVNVTERTVRSEDTALSTTRTCASSAATAPRVRRNRI